MILSNELIMKLVNLFNETEGFKIVEALGGITKFCYAGILNSKLVVVPISKEKVYFLDNLEKYGQEIKPSRLFSLAGIKEPSVLETVNARLRGTKKEFLVVEKDEIRKGYLADNYKHYEKGSLGGSCMRYDYCQEYLDIYVKSNKIKLLTLLEDGQIIGRALLWTLDSIKIVDRIYTKDYNDERLFKDWARKNGYHYRLRQSFEDKTLFISPNNTKEELKIKFNTGIHIKELKHFPYLDTFTFVKISKRGEVILSNYNNNSTYKAASTQGDLLTLKGVRYTFYREYELYKFSWRKVHIDEVINNVYEELAISILGEIPFSEVVDVTDVIKADNLKAMIKRDIKENPEKYNLIQLEMWGPLYIELNFSEKVPF